MSAIITSRFQIEDLLEQDETGVTYIAEDKETGLKVALRRFFRKHTESMKNAESELFRKELKNAITLKHPSLRRVLGGGIDDVDNVGFIATRWVEGVSIAERTKGKYIDATEGVKIVRQALELMLFLEDQTPLTISMTPRTIIQSKDDLGCYTFWFGLDKFSSRRKGTRKKRFFAEMIQFLDAVLEQSTMVGESHYCRLRGWMDLLESSGFSYDEALRALPDPDDTLTPFPGVSGQGMAPAVDALHIYNSHIGNSSVEPPKVPTARIRKEYKRHTLWRKEQLYNQRRLAAICAGGVIAIIIALVVVSIVTNP